MAAVGRWTSWLTGRRGAVIVLVAVWLVVIAASAGQPADSESWVGLPNDNLFGLFIVAALVAGPVFLLISIIRNRRSGAPPPGRRPPILAALIVMIILVALGQRNVEPPAEEPIAAEEPVAPSEEPEPIRNPSAGMGRGEFTVLVLMLGAALAVLLWSRTRASEEADVLVEAEDDELDAVLGPALERAERHLLLATDPRSAVLLAYADLEAALVHAGHGPADHETPGEHLRRALQHLTVDPEPLYRLADLYELARFSSHEITTAQQHAAAAALDQTRRQLAPVQ